MRINQKSPTLFSDTETTGYRQWQQQDEEVKTTLAIKKEIAPR